MAADAIALLLKNDAGSVLNTFNVPLNKLNASVAPTASDDDVDGYVGGSIWIDLVGDAAYVCVDNSTGAAVWILVGGSANIQTLLDGISTTTGDILSYSGIDWVGISPGTAGYVLTSNGAGLSPTYQAPTTTLADGDYSDITVSSLGTVMTIDNGVVTYAKIQNVSATDKLLGRSSSGAGVVEEIACTAFGRSLIDDAAASNARTTLGATTVGGNLFTLSNPSAVTFPRFNIDNTVDALSASVFRTAIGATDVGSHLFTLANPSAIRFLRINVDNTVSALSASDFRTAIGADYTSSNLRGAFAGAPAAGTGGRTYRCTDSKFFGYDTGSAWKWSWDGVEIADLAAAASWTQANSVSATYTTTYGGTIIAAAAQASVSKLGAMYCTAPSAPYANGVRIGMRLPALGSYYGGMGCGWSDGTKYVLWMFAVPNGSQRMLLRLAFDTTAALNGAVDGLINQSAYDGYMPDTIYYKLVDDNTNLIVSVSYDDGKQWNQVDSVARTGYLSSPSKIACGINPYNQATSAWFFDKTDL